MKSEDKHRQQRWAEVKKAAGLCPCCGQERRDFNPRTGKPYHLGPLCRKKVNDGKRRYMRNFMRKKRAGEI